MPEDLSDADVGLTSDLSDADVGLTAPSKESLSRFSLQQAVDIPQTVLGTLQAGATGSEMARAERASRIPIVDPETQMVTGYKTPEDIYYPVGLEDIHPERAVAPIVPIPRVQATRPTLPPGAEPMIDPETQMLAGFHAPGGAVIPPGIDPVAAAVINTPASFAEGIESPVGLLTIPASAYRFGQAAIRGIFGGLAAKSGGEALGEASVTGDVQKAAEGLLQLGAAPFITGRGEPLTMKGPTDASGIQKAAKVYGDLQPQPEQGPGEVSVQESRAGVLTPSEAVAEAAQVPLEPESAAVKTFREQMADRTVPVRNTQTAQAGMSLESVADLDSMLQMLKDERTASTASLAEAQRTGDFSKMTIGRDQYPREVIETATKSGSWEEDFPEMGVEGERPLQWDKNPEVADWIRQHAKEIWTNPESYAALPDALKAKPSEPILASRTPEPEAQASQLIPSQPRPSYQDYIKGLKGTWQPGRIREAWQDSVWKHLMEATGSRLAQLRDQLGLGRQVGREAFPDPIGPEEPITGQQQRRFNVIARIGEKLIGESEQKAVGWKRKDITPEDIGWWRGDTSAQPVFHTIASQELADPVALGIRLTADSGVSRITVIHKTAEGKPVEIRTKAPPESVTKRLVALQDPKTGKIELVSTYRKGGGVGPMIVDPVKAAAGNPRPNVPFQTILPRYTPVYSILLDEPVQSFHKSFESAAAFEEQFATPARQGLAEHKASYEPISEGVEAAGRPGVVTAVPGPQQAKPSVLATPEAITEPEARAAAVQMLGEAEAPQTVEGIRARLADLGQSQNWQAISGLQKLWNAFRAENKGLDLDTVYEKFEQELAGTVEKGGGVQAISRAFAQRAAKGAGEPVPGGAAPASVEGAEYQEIGHGGETALESRTVANPASGLPPSVPDRGPKFAAELMEASRRLGTLVKSKVNLPPDVLGRYRKARASIGQDDAIEVGDIRNQNTVAHEMGHDLDGLLFPQQNFGDSQRSLAERVGTGTPKELMAELVPVSELMRGPITGSKGHQAYRKRATELVADFFALYAHDAERAQAMAPKFSQGFEIALGQDFFVGHTVAQLRGGKVEPISPTRLSSPVGQPAGMPGAVPGRTVAPPIPRDRAIAVAAEDLVTGQIRNFEAEVQGARVKADQWREAVPNREARNDVGAFVEGIGNLEIPNDTASSVRDRMSEEGKQLAKDYRYSIELQRQRINEYLKDGSAGEYLKFLDDYLPHFYANSKTPVGRQAMARFIKESPNAKQRKIPTLREAVDYGLIPITQDPAVLYEATARINWRVATNRKMLAATKDIKTADGGPIIVPAGKAPPGWVFSDNPLIQRIYARKLPSATMLWRGGAAIHPDAWPALRQMLESPISTELGRAYDAVNAVTRANAFAFAMFHDVTLRSASLGAQMEWFNPARGLFRVFERNALTGKLEILRGTRALGKEMLKDEETVTDAARHGMKFAWTDSESYQHAARDFLDKSVARWRDNPLLGVPARLARDAQAWRQKGLWRNTHDAYKIAAYEDLTAKALQGAPPGMDPSIVKKRVASLLNDAFGGQEWQTKFWLSPQMRRNMSRFFLAPDWTFSTLRSVPFMSDALSMTRGQLSRLGGAGAAPVSMEGLLGNLGRARFWGAEIAALATATIAAQYAIYQAFGKKERGDKPWIWQNETGQNRRVDATPLIRNLPWHDPKDQTRYYVNLGKRPEEIVGWFSGMDRTIMSKMARPVAEVFRQVTGTEGDFKAEWKRDHEAFLESLPARAKSAAKEFLPLSLSGNQFALSLPYRKGMSKYKAQQAFESAYEIQADPSRFKSFLRGVPADPTKALADIMDAAHRNGVPADPIRKRALSTVRGAHYDAFFKAFQKGDQSTMEKEASALLRLGAGIESIKKSVQTKQALQPALLP